MAQTIRLMAPAQAQIRPKALAMSMNKEALTDTNLASSTLSIALASMLDVPEARADCTFSIEERICRNGRTSVSAIIGRMHSRNLRASHDRLACGGREFRHDLNASSLQSCGSLNDQGNPLNSQQMRPPSERTRKPRLALKLLTLVITQRRLRRTDATGVPSVILRLSVIKVILTTENSVDVPSCREAARCQNVHCLH